MKVSPQTRKQNPSLPEFWYARAVSYELNGVEKRVLTSLPADRYPAKAVAELYHCRWEIEVGFRNIKSSLQSNVLVLRSRKVELLHQEVWGLLLAYNLIRRAAALAAKHHKRAPSEISFKFAFDVISAELYWLGNTISPGTIPKRLMQLRGSLEAIFITKRPRPSRRGRLRYLKPAIRLTAMPHRLSERHCAIRWAWSKQIPTLLTNRCVLLHKRTGAH